MNKRFSFVFLILCVVGFILVTSFWPKNEKLPLLDKVENFHLDDVHGDRIYKSDNDKVKLVAFFYTNCPDICPLTMMDFQHLQENLKETGDFGENVELIAISLDPEQDTQEIIKKYASSFQADLSGWKWLRGTNEQTKQVADQLNVQYQKLEGDFLSHSTTMYLLDNNNNLRALYDMASSSNSINKERILTDIAYLTNNR